MTEQINKNEILDSFVLHMNEINFLKKDNKLPPPIKKNINNYIKILKSDVSIEEHLEVGEKLWTLLFKKALFSLTRDLQGSKAIFDYFKKYIDFETLLFGVDEFYRDHTLHSLWVYFLGEYLLKGGYIEPKDMQVSIEFYENLKDNEKVQRISDESRKSVLKYIDEIWCIIALAHDLGYPISSIEKINKKINSILPYYGKFIKQEFGLEKTFIQKETSEKMLKLISSDILYVKDSPNQILKHHLYLSLYDSLENFDHGVLSSYLIFKSLSSMIRTPFYETGSNVVHDEKELISYLSNQAILRSIALHTCKIKLFSKFPSFESLLVLSDEIEEFSRWTRAKNKRSYIDDICKVYIDITKENIILEYVFDSDIKIDPEQFFINKSKVFMNMFDTKLSNMPNPSENDNPPNITIDLKDKLETPHKHYTFKMENNNPLITITTLSADRKVKKIDDLEKIDTYLGLT